MRRPLIDSEFDPNFPILIQEGRAALNNAEGQHVWKQVHDLRAHEKGEIPHM